MTATQLVNPEIDRVDAVNGPATGMPFLMFKSLDAPVAAEPEEALTVAKSEDAAPAEETAEEVVKSEDEIAFEAWKAGQAPVEKAAEAAEEVVVEVEKAAEEVVVEVEKAAEAPAEDTPAPAEEVEKGLGGQGHLPSGLQEILDTFVESYCRYKEAQASGAAAAMAAEGSVEDHLKPAVASADIPAAPPAPVAPEPVAPEVPVAEEAPAEAVAEKPAEEAPAAPEAVAEPNAPEEPPAAAEAPAEAPAEEEDDEKPFPPKKVAKSMDELIAEAVSKAIAEAQAPLLKQIDALERMPINDGPMFAGQTPGNAGTPLLGRGQAEGVVAKGLVEKSAAAQAAPGAYALAEALKGVHTGKL